MAWGSWRKALTRDREVDGGSGLMRRMTPLGGICSRCRGAPFQGKWWGGWWQPVTSAARCLDGVTHHHISGSSRCPGGQQLGGRAWMFFWKSRLSPARLDKECGLPAFWKLKIFTAQDRHPLGEAVLQCPLGSGTRCGCQGLVVPRGMLRSLPRMSWLRMVPFPTATSPFPSLKQKTTSCLNSACVRPHPPFPA